MSELEGKAEKGKVRKCEWCRKPFEASSHNQAFHNKKCQYRAARARERDRQGLQDHRPAPILPAKILLDLQAQRARVKVPKLEVLEYLECRAGVLEAEEQMRRWSQRLLDRKARLAVLEEPPLRREVHILLGETETELAIAPRATGIGIVSLDGLVGVAVIGLPR